MERLSGMLNTVPIAGAGNTSGPSTETRTPIKNESTPLMRQNSKADVLPSRGASLLGPANASFSNAQDREQLMVQAFKSFGIKDATIANAKQTQQNVQQQIGTYSLANLHQSPSALAATTQAMAQKAPGNCGERTCSTCGSCMPKATEATSSEESKQVSESFGMQLAGMVENGTSTPAATAKVLNAMASLNENEAAHAFIGMAKESPDLAAKVLNEMISQDTQAASKMVAQAVKEGAQAMKEAVSNLVSKSPENAGKMLAQVANASPNEAVQLIVALADAFFDAPAVFQTTLSAMAQDLNPMGTQALAQLVADNPAQGETIMAVLLQTSPEVAQAVQNSADSILAVKQFNTPQVLEFNGQMLSRPGAEGTPQVGDMQNLGTQALPANLAAITNASPREVAVQLLGMIAKGDVAQAATTLAALASFGQSDKAAASLAALINGGKGAEATALLTVMMGQNQAPQAAMIMASMVNTGHVNQAAQMLTGMSQNGNLAQASQLISAMLAQGNAKEVGLVFNAMVNQGQVKELANLVQFMVNNGQMADVALAVASMNVGAAVQLFSTLPPQTGAQIMAQMVAQGSTAQAAQILTQLPTQHAAQLVSAMVQQGNAQQAAMIMGQMVAQGSTAQAANILAAMPPKDAAAVLFQMASSDPKAMLSILVTMAQNSPKQALAVLELLLTMDLPKGLKQQLQTILNAIKEGKISELDLAKMLDELDPALLAAIAAAMSDEEENMKLERKLNAKKAKEDAEKEGDGGEAMLQSLQQFDEKLAMAYAFGLKKRKERESKEKRESKARQRNLVAVD
ncbi:MAG: hypothetical protein O3A01_02965 [bacterium]|nr:hypothetical protein [bacterium]